MNFDMFIVNYNVDANLIRFEKFTIKDTSVSFLESILHIVNHFILFFLGYCNERKCN